MSIPEALSLVLVERYIREVPQAVVDLQKRIESLPPNPGTLTPPINQQPKTQPVGVNINIIIPPHTPATQ